ncbi:MAG: hypothetical protein ABL893_08305, partial [Hyphomicrobium sp.]
MRRKSRLVLGLVLASLWFQPAFAVEPDDLPWDEIDRILKEAPGAPAGDQGAPAGDAESDSTASPNAAADPKPGSTTSQAAPGVFDDPEPTVAPTIAPIAAPSAAPAATAATAAPATPVTPPAAA